MVNSTIEVVEAAQERMIEQVVARLRLKKLEVIERFSFNLEKEKPVFGINFG